MDIHKSSCLNEKVGIGEGTAPSGDEQIVSVYDPEQDSYSTYLHN